MILEICVCVLVAVLLAAQLFLSFKQIKSKAPDGKILLVISAAVTLVWTPLSIIMFITRNTGVKIAWFAVSAIYMVFTMWYTNSLQKNFKK